MVLDTYNFADYERCYHCRTARLADEHPLNERWICKSCGVDHPLDSNAIWDNRTSSMMDPACHFCRAVHEDCLKYRRRVNPRPKAKAKAAPGGGDGRGPPGDDGNDDQGDDTGRPKKRTRKRGRGVKGLRKTEGSDAGTSSGARSSIAGSQRSKIRATACPLPPMEQTVPVDYLIVVKGDSAGPEALFPEDLLNLRVSR